MKKILIVEDPGSCEECPCYHEDRDVCQAGGLYGRPCPLRPLPQKKNTDFSPNIVYANGWNACIKELEK